MIYALVFMFGVHYNLSSLPFRSSDQTTYPLVKCFVNENVILVLEHENYISQGVSQHSSQVETKIDIIDNVLLPGIGQMFLLTLFNLGSLLVPPCCQMIFDIFLNNNCFKSFETSSSHNQVITRVGGQSLLVSRNWSVMEELLDQVTDNWGESWHPLWEEMLTSLTWWRFIRFRVNKADSSE